MEGKRISLKKTLRGRYKIRRVIKEENPNLKYGIFKYELSTKYKNNPLDDFKFEEIDIDTKTKIKNTSRRYFLFLVIMFFGISFSFLSACASNRPKGLYVGSPGAAYPIDFIALRTVKLKGTDHIYGFKKKGGGTMWREPLKGEKFQRILESDPFLRRDLRGLPYDHIELRLRSPPKEILADYAKLYKEFLNNRTVEELKEIIDYNGDKYELKDSEILDWGSENKPKDYKTLVNGIQKVYYEYMNNK